MPGNHTIKGEIVFEEINKWVSDYKRKSQGLANHVYGVEESISALDREREGIIAKLATTYLPDMTAQSVRSTLAELRGSITEVFQDKQERRRELEQLMNGSLERQEALDEAIANNTALLNDAADRRDTLRGELSAQLVSDVTYQHLDQQVQQATAKLVVYKRRVEEVTQLAKEKLPAYRRNKLFNYLSNKGYDPIHNPGEGLIGRLDATVARIVRYTEQKKKYDFLMSMPTLMGQDVERRQFELDSVAARMAALESELSERAGLPAIIEEGELLEEGRVDLTKQKSSEDSNYRKLEKQRAALDNEKGTYHTEAIGLYKRFLKGSELAELRALVRSTESTEDDHYLDRMEEIDAQVRSLKDEAKIIRSDREAVEADYTRLRSIQKYFDTKDYESSRSYFKTGFDMTDHLQDLVDTDSDTTLNAIKRALKDNQYTQPVERYGSSRYPSDRRYSSTRRTTTRRSTWDDDDNDSGLGSILTTPSRSSRKSSSSSSSSNSGWGFGGGGSISIGSGFGGGGGGSSSIGSGW